MLLDYFPTDPLKPNPTGFDIVIGQINFLSHPREHIVLFLKDTSQFNPYSKELHEYRKELEYHYDQSS